MLCEQARGLLDFDWCDGHISVVFDYAGLLGFAADVGRQAASEGIASCTVAE